MVRFVTVTVLDYSIYTPPRYSLSILLPALCTNRSNFCTAPRVLVIAWVVPLSRPPIHPLGCAVVEKCWRSLSLASSFSSLFSSLSSACNPPWSLSWTRKVNSLSISLHAHAPLRNPELTKRAPGEFAIPEGEPLVLCYDAPQVCRLLF